MINHGVKFVSVGRLVVGSENVYRLRGLVM